MSLYKNASDDFYDSWESKSLDERENFIASRLSEYVTHLSSVELYKDIRDHYKPGNNNPLTTYKTMSSKELRDNIPPMGSGLVTSSTGHTVFQSGGTTGMPKTTLFSHSEMEKLNLPNARGFYALGLTEEDRVANLFAVGGLYMTFIHINNMLERYGCMNFPFSNHTPANFIHSVAKHFQINCITGIASVGLTALREMYKLGMEDIKIDKFLYGGEHFYEADRQELKDKMGIELIAAPGYGTVDSWYIGYQCLHCAEGIFHAHDDQTYIELINEETGAHCTAGEIGMMYVTPFERLLTPVVRYKVGDLAKWTGEPCKCGRTTPTFKLLGRGDDILRIGYDSIEYNFIQEVVAKVDGLLGTIQMEKMRREGKDLLTIRIESDSSPELYNDLANKLTELIMKDRPSLSSFIAKGTVHPLAIEIVEPNSLKRNPRTGKLIRVIDSI